MNEKTDWVTRAIDLHKRDARDIPKWMLNAYAPKPAVPAEEKKEKK